MIIRTARILLIIITVLIASVFIYAKSNSILIFGEYSSLSDYIYIGLAIILGIVYQILDKLKH